MKVRLGIIHAGFALTGVATTMLGPLLPYLSGRWDLTDAQAGRFFTAQFLASVTGCVIASWVLGRWGAAVTVRIGMFLIAAGVVCLGMGELMLAVTGIAVYGLGLGFALPSTNLWVSELAAEGRSSALNLLNFTWTVGALGAPILLAALLKPIGLRGAMLLLGGAVLLIAVAETVMTHAGQAESSAANQGPTEVALPGPRFSLAILTTVFLFLYVGAENGVAGWLPSFAGRTHKMSANSAAVLQSCFWGAILLGRLLAPVVLRRLAPASLVKAGLAAGIAGTLICVASLSSFALVAGAILSGLGLSTLFPTVASIFIRWYGTKGAGSIVLGLGGLGGALIPWLVGMVTYHFDSLRLGFSLTLVSILCATVVFWRIDWLVRTEIAPR